MADSTEAPIPFGRSAATGMLLGPEDVPRGLRCACVCPGCAFPLIARQGTEKAWHFAHARGSTCVAGRTNSIHAFAKQVCKSIELLRVPAGYANASARDAFGFLQTATVDICNEQVLSVKCAAESPASEYVTSDAAFDTEVGVVLVEIVVIQRVSDDKQKRLSETQLPVLQIDLNGRLRAIPSADEVRDAVMHSADRRWLYHPKTSAADSEAKALLHTKLVEQKRLFDSRPTLPPLARPRWTHLPQPTYKVGHSPAQLQWRASFPEKQQIVAARATLLSGCEGEESIVDAMVSSIPNRSSLARTEPDAFIHEWADKLKVNPQLIVAFVVEANLAWII